MVAKFNSVQAAINFYITMSGCYFKWGGGERRYIKNGCINFNTHYEKNMLVADYIEANQHLGDWEVDI